MIGGRVLAEAEYTREGLLARLRDRSVGTAEFRAASDGLARLLRAEAVGRIGSVADDGGRGVLLAPVMRAGLALLPAFMEALPGARVGMVGVERDERTATPRVYYEKLPAGLADALPAKAVILDPMLATAGSACYVAGLLIGRGMRAEDVHFVGVLAAQEGLERLASVVPRGNITLAAVDPGLDARKFIVPGIGDYGDRYFGTAD